jgi:DNA end-binding protein Ku
MATPRSIASVTISFGLVAIPVKVYTAHDTSGDLRFNLLHATCGSRLRQQYVCVKEDVVVPREEMAKGYEVAKDQFVLFQPDELQAIEEPPTQAIEIAEFLPLAAVDPVYFEKTYYLAPDKGGNKPYALLQQSLAETSRCAVGRWAARGKQYLVLLRVVDGVLTLQQLHYANEIRRPDAIEVPDVKVGEAELKLARQLIDSQATERFRPEAYADDVRRRVEQAIKQKVEGQEVRVAEARPAAGGGQVIDLMEALRRSLEQQGRTPPAASAPAARARKPAARATRAAAGPSARESESASARAADATPARAADEGPAKSRRKASRR